MTEKELKELSDKILNVRKDALEKRKRIMKARLDKMIKARHILLERLIENDNLERYREYMICRILELQKQDQYTRDELLKKSIRELEDIFADVE